MDEETRALVEVRLESSQEDLVTAKELLGLRDIEPQ